MSFFGKNKTAPEDIDVTHLERESNVREFSGIGGKIITGILLCLTLFQLYSSVMGTIPPQLVRMTHLSFVIPLSYWLYPATEKGNRYKMNYIDLLLGFVYIGVALYYILNYKELVRRSGAYTQLDVIVGAIAVVLVLEACRRVVGLPIVVIAGVFLLYAYFGPIMPGFLRHRGYSFSRIVTHMFYTTEGIMGMPLGVCSTFVFLFILFGAFLEKTGIGAFFIDIANALAGWAAGGPAKVAVLTSALQGTVSGSSVSNTVSTGSFTIPLMKSLGYKPEFAGAVEAAASTGGQLMPPIMGAAAFLIAETIGVSYLEVAKAAIIPALLYFLGIWIMVHLEARKLGLRGLPREQLPKAGKLMLEKGHLILPLVSIVIFLLMGFTTTRAALGGIVTAIICPFLRKNTHVPVQDIFSALIVGARNIISVACACSTAGIIVGVVTLTGLGLKFGDSLIALTAGRMFPTLVVTMITSIILGMGVPTTANYLITSVIAAPIVIKLGVPTLAAHMFAFYFGIVADITPPVALAAYAGSAIAKSDPFWTGVNATKLAIAAFLVPYMFVYNPQLILIDTTPLGVIQITATSIIGMIGIGAGMTGYFVTNTPWYQRLILIVGGIMLVHPGWVTDICGVALIAAIYIWQKYNAKKHFTDKPMS